MKDNRRDFLKKSASLAAAVSVGSLVNGMPGHETMKNTPAPKPFKIDAGMKFSFLMNPKSPRVPFAKQMGVNYAVSGVERIQDVKPWDPQAISATKKTWDDLGIKWTVVEGPPSLGEKTKLGLEGRDEEIANFITFMKNLRQYGDVDIICYNWMPVISWARTNMERPGRGGALMLEFDYDASKGKPLTKYGEVSKETLWKNYEYFIKIVDRKLRKLA